MENLPRVAGMDIRPQIGLYPHERPTRAPNTSRQRPKDPMSQPAATDERATKLSIGFINWAHALDHYVMLIFPTVVIGLELIFSKSYAELIALGTASFVAFGVFSLPAGWLADRWSRRNMMALFYAGCGLSLIAAGLASDLIVLAVALTALGVFAAIYHPVGTAMLIEQATTRGRSLAFNGVCGNLGVALAAGITAVLVYAFGWRGAFLVPAIACVITGIAYWFIVPDERRKGVSRDTSPEVVLSPAVAATIFVLFILIAVSAGLVFHIATIALPKIVDERVGLNASLIQVGGIATVILMCGAIAQLTIGRLVDKIPLNLLFAGVALMQFVGVVWVASASRPKLELYV